MMIPVQLENDPVLSRLKRNALINEALYWRKSGNRLQKQVCLRQARDERINQRYFLDDGKLPF